MAQVTTHPDRRVISSEDVVGTDVYGRGDEAVGKIDHLMIEQVSGKVAYAVMSFGGFLGLAHSHYPIPWSALKYDTALGGFRTGITEEQLRDAPEFSRRFLGRPRLGNAHASALWRQPLLGRLSRLSKEDQSRASNLMALGRAARRDTASLARRRILDSTKME